MKIDISIDDLDGVTDKPFTASLTVTSDDGRVAEAESAGIGATPIEALRDLVRSNSDSEQDLITPALAAIKGSTDPRDCVMVSGGLVQNDPGIPVFDFDVLDSDFVDHDAVAEAQDLYERLREFGLAADDDDVLAVHNFIVGHGDPSQVDWHESFVASCDGR